MDKQQVLIKRQAEKVLGYSIRNPKIESMEQDGGTLTGVFKSGGNRFDFILKPGAKKNAVQYKMIQK